MLLHQAVEQRFVGGAPHLLNLNRAEVLQLASIGVWSNSTGCRPRALRQWIVPTVA